MVRGQRATTTNALVESLTYFSDHAGLATTKELRINCPAVDKIRSVRGLQGTPEGVKVMKILKRRGWVTKKTKIQKVYGKSIRVSLKRRGSTVYSITKEGVKALGILRSGNENAIISLLMGVE